MPLSTIRTGHDPSDWSRISDRQAAVALTEFEASVCGDCGQPKARAFNQDMSGWYDVAEVECHGCAAIAEHLAAAGDERRPHVKLAVLDTYDEAEQGPLRPLGGGLPDQHDQQQDAPPPAPDPDSIGGEH